MCKHVHFKKKFPRFCSHFYLQFEGLLEHTFPVSGPGINLPSWWGGHPVGRRDLEKISGWWKALRGLTWLDVTTHLHSREPEQHLRFLKTVGVSLPSIQAKGFLADIALPGTHFSTRKKMVPLGWKGLLARSWPPGHTWSGRGGRFSRKDPTCSFQKGTSQNVQKQVVKMFFWRHLLVPTINAHLWKY